MFAINITCLGCCPIVISDSEYRQVADDFAQSNENSAVTASLVYAENQVQMQKVKGQVGHEEKVEGQASEELFKQGREMAGVSKFVNIVELEQPKTSMGERSNSSITQGGDDGKNDEVAGRESPPPPPPPPRPIDNNDVNPVLSLYESQINPEEKGRPDSPPPPPPPRINYPQSERSVSPPPLPQGDTMSQGFYSFGSADQTTGGRLDTIQVQNEKSTLTEELRGQSPLPEINTEIRSAGFMNYVPENALNGVVIEYKTWTTETKPSSELKINNKETSAQLSSPGEESLWV